MSIILKNETTKEVREQNTGLALYLLLFLIPYFGNIIVLIVGIMRKQFKLFLNYIFVIYIYAVSSASIMLGTLTIISVYPNLGSIILIEFLLFIMIYIIIFIYILIRSILGANYWSYNQYIKDGYIVVNTDDIAAQEFIEKAKTKTRPWWVLFL